MKRPRPSLTYSAYPGYILTICRGFAEHQACRDLCLAHMQQPSYGVTDRAIIERWLSPLDRFLWMAAQCRETNTLMGIFRIEIEYDLSQFTNISMAIQKTCRPPYRIVDIGASIGAAGKERGRIFEGLFTLALKYLLETGQLGVYIQVAPGQVTQYCALGFRPITTPFQPQGYRSWWQGMLLRLEELTQHWAESSFQKSWYQETGVPLRASFWQRLMNRVKSAEGWTTTPVEMEKMDL